MGVTEGAISWIPGWEIRRTVLDVQGIHNANLPPADELIVHRLFADVLMGDCSFIAYRRMRIYYKKRKRNRNRDFRILVRFFAMYSCVLGARFPVFSSSIGESCLDILLLFSLPFLTSSLNYYYLRFSSYFFRLCQKNDVSRNTTRFNCNKGGFRAVYFYIRGGLKKGYTFPIPYLSIIVDDTYLV